MLSRVASSIYWLSRYIERAENVARFVDVNSNLTLGKNAPIRGQWSPLVSITGDEELYNDPNGAPTRAGVLHFLMLDRRNPNSIWSCIELARENARGIRDVLPVSVWEQINRFYHMIQSTDDLPMSDPVRFCEQVKLASHVIDGMCDSTMAHDEAWHFARLGRLTERADKTSRIVDVQYYLLLPKPFDVGSAIDTVRWVALLKSTTSLSRYRKMYGSVEPARVAEFLILDREFPRSMRFCLIQAQASLRAITGTRPDTFQYSSEQVLGQLRAHLDYATIDDLIRQGLHDFVGDFQQRLNQVGDSIEANFFDNPRRTDASLRFDPRSRQFAKHGDRERRRQPSFEPNP